MKIAIYVRVSTSMQADKDSLPMQKKDLIGYSELILHCKDYVIFEDAGYSGKNTDRPSYQEMMSRIRANEFTHLLVWKIDRISRNLLDFASMYSELKKLGVVFISKNEQFDTSNAIGEAMLKIILVFAELERNMTSERVSATMLSRANNGFWNGGRIPYGYDYDSDKKEFIVNEPEANTIRLLYDSYIKGDSLLTLTRQLNEKHITTKQNKEWSPNTVYIILRNPFYYGVYRYNLYINASRQNLKDSNEWVVIDNHHPAIIDKSTYDKAQDRFKLQNRTYKRGEKTIHIFGNHLICGECGAKMMASVSKPLRNGLRLSSYTCPSTRTSGIKHCHGSSDSTIGEFFFNYVLRILYIKNHPDRFPDTDSIQEYLLEGSTFAYIDHIETEGLVTLYNLARAVLEPDRINTIPEPRNDGQTQKQTLHDELHKLKRALKRLEDLYLYDDTSMSKAEYISQRTEIIENINDTESEISAIDKSNLGVTISDSDLVESANNYILNFNLTFRNYANFKNLCLEIDHKTLKSFVDSICDNIVTYQGKVKSITFKNGMHHSFVYRTDGLS